MLARCKDKTNTRYGGRGIRVCSGSKGVAMAEEALAEIVHEGLVNGSASGAARLLECPPSVVLPQSSRSTDDSDRGTSLHNYISAVLTGSSAEDALAHVPDEAKETARHIDFRKLGADLTTVRSESAFAINPRKLSARFLGCNIHRDYARHSITKDELAGSSDIDGLDEYYDNRPCVIDVKTGFRRVAPAESNPQLLVYACALAWISGADEVEGRICYVRPSGAVEVDSAVYDRFRLDAFALELEQAFDEVQAARRVLLAGGTPTVSPGEWCGYCGALDVCPSQVALARAMVTEVDTLGANLSDVELRSRIESLSLDQAGSAWKKAKQIETLLERVLAALKTRAMQETLPLGNGREVRRVSYPRESFVQARAVQMLKDKGASDGELATLYRTVEIDTPKECSVPGAKKGRKKPCSTPF